MRKGPSTSTEGAGERRVWLKGPGFSRAPIPVPEGADGQIWHTTNMTRGQVSLLNVPPLLSLHRTTVFIPREIAQAEGPAAAKEE